MTEKVGIHRVNLVEGLAESEVVPLMDLTMTIRDRVLFHQQLASMGYYVGEGMTGEIDEGDEIGTIFNLYRIRDGQRTDERVGTISTLLDTDVYQETRF